MRVARGPAAWARRALLAIVLVGAAVIPGRATSQQAPHCTGLRCTTAGSVLWSRGLPGSWIAQSGVSGTVADRATAYAGVGGGIAVVGSGTEVTGYKARSGRLLWHVGLTGLPLGSAIVSVRAFPGVVAVGVEPPGGQGSAVRDEVILSASTGRQVRMYPAAAYGGAVEADTARTVVVGSSAVIAYDNATGRVLWHRAIGSGSPPWHVADQYLYVTDADGRDAAAGVSALLRISLLTGAQQIVRPQSKTFAGTFSGVIDVLPPAGEPQTILLFSGADGVTAYGLNGSQLWHKNSAVLELADTARGVVYVGDGSSLVGIDAAGHHGRRGQHGSHLGRCQPLLGQRQRRARARRERPRRGLGLQPEQQARGLDLDCTALAALLRGPVRPWRQRQPVEQYSPAGDVHAGRHSTECGRRSGLHTAAASSCAAQIEMSRGRWHAAGTTLSAAEIQPCAGRRPAQAGLGSGLGRGHRLNGRAYAGA